MKTEQWLLLRATLTLNTSGKQLNYNAFDTNSRKHTHTYMCDLTHTRTHCFVALGNLRYFVPRPEMLNVIQTFFKQQYMP